MPSPIGVFLSRGLTGTTSWTSLYQQSEQDQPRSPRPNWRPWILRPLGMSLVLLICLVAIVLLECAARTVPIHFVSTRNVTVTASGTSATVTAHEKRSGNLHHQSTDSYVETGQTDISAYTTSTSVGAATASDVSRDVGYGVSTQTTSLSQETTPATATDSDVASVQFTGVPTPKITIHQYAPTSGYIQPTQTIVNVQAAYSIATMSPSLASTTADVDTQTDDGSSTQTTPLPQESQSITVSDSSTTVSESSYRILHSASSAYIDPAQSIPSTSSLETVPLHTYLSTPESAYIVVSATIQRTLPSSTIVIPPTLTAPASALIDAGQTIQSTSRPDISPTTGYSSTTPEAATFLYVQPTQTIASTYSPGTNPNPPTQDASTDVVASSVPAPGSVSPSSSIPDNGSPKSAYIVVRQTIQSTYTQDVSSTASDVSTTNVFISSAVRTTTSSAVVISPTLTAPSTLPTPSTLITPSTPTTPSIPAATPTPIATRVSIAYVDVSQTIQSTLVTLVPSTHASAYIDTTAYIDVSETIQTTYLQNSTQPLYTTPATVESSVTTNSFVTLISQPSQPTLTAMESDYVEPTQTVFSAYIQTVEGIHSTHTTTTSSSASNIISAQTTNSAELTSAAVTNTDPLQATSSPQSETLSQAPDVYIIPTQTSQNSVAASSIAGIVDATQPPPNSVQSTTTIAASNYISPSQTQSASAQRSITMAGTAAIVYIDPTQTISVSLPNTASVATSDYIDPVASISVSGSSTTTIAASNYINPAQVSSAPESGTIAGGYVNPEQTVHSTVSITTAGTSTDSQQTAYPTPPSTSVVTSTTAAPGSQTDTTHSPIVVTVNSATYVHPDSAVSSGVTLFASGTTPNTVAITTNSAAYVQPGPTISSSIIPSGPNNTQAFGASTSPSATISATASTASTNLTNAAGHEVVVVSDTVLHYPTWASVVAYAVPVAIAATYKVIWTAVYRSVNLVEPFIISASPGGALAANSMFTNYLSTSLGFRTIRSFGRGQWRVFWTSFGYALTILAAPIASEVLYTDTFSCAKTSPEYNPNHPSNPCWPVLNGSIRTMRVLEAFFSFLAILTVVLGVTFHFKHETGLQQNPSAISTIASLAHHSEIVAAFSELDGNSNIKKLEKKIGSKRFGLALYSTPSENIKHGFGPIVDDQPKDETSDGPLLASQHPTASPASEIGMSTRRRRNYTPFFYDFALGFLVLGTFAVVVGYYIDGSNSGFNRFFNSGKWGPRFIITCTGGLVAAQWQWVERDVQLLSVYARLARGNAAAADTINVTFPSTPVTAIIPALRRRNYMLAVVATLAVLAEVLVIALAGVPFTAGELYHYALACSYISIAILGMMVIAVPFLVIWRLRLPYLPRNPDTIAAVISYVVGSRLISEIQETEYVGKTVHEAVLYGDSEMMQTRWRYGEMEYEDGTLRWMIDEDDGHGHGRDDDDDDGVVR